jgi:hypothetical protein
LKPEKPPNELMSYQPISLFEKLLLKRFFAVIENNRLVPNHQFGFRRRHCTIEERHRIV